MKKLILLAMVIGLLMVLNGVSYSQETQDVTLLGITLGKSLQESGISECQYTWIRLNSKYIPDRKSYTHRDSDCYWTDDVGTCTTYLSKNLSFGGNIYITLRDKCDRTSPVQQIEIQFSSDSFSKMLELTTGKFGTPSKIDKSTVQNKMGASFEKLEMFWNVKGHTIYLTNRAFRVDEGLLVIKHPDKVRQDTEKAQKREKSDRDKF